MKYSKDSVIAEVHAEIAHFVDTKLQHHDYWDHLFVEEDYDSPEECWQAAEDFLEKVNNLKVTVIIEEK